MDPYRMDTAKLYLEICTRPFGTHLWVDGDGAAHTADGSLSLNGFPEDWFYFGRAEGDFNRDGGGVRREGETFAVQGLDGRFNHRRAKRLS